MASDARNAEPLQVQNVSPGDAEGEEQRKRIRTFNAQHTLDSDEEDEKETAEQRNRLDAKAARQFSERRTILNDDGIKISPFNLKDELRTGHFDRDGNYVFKQKRRRGNEMDEPGNDDEDDDDENIADAWLEGVDWAAIKAREDEAINAIKPVKRQLPTEDSDTSGHDGSAERELVADKQDETTPSADRAEKTQGNTNGNSSSSASKSSRPILRSKNAEPKRVKQRVTWDAATQEKEASAVALDDEYATMSEDDRMQLYRNIIEFMQPLESVTKAIQRLGREGNGKDNVNSLTGYVGELVDEGKYDVYDWTYEKLQSLVKTEPSLDIFGGDFPEDDQPTSSSNPVTVTDSAVGNTSAGTNDQVVYWLYKWENVDTATTYGPFSSEQMQQWCDAGHFGAGVWVRRNDADKNAPFYTSKRVDFDLYT